MLKKEEYQEMKAEKLPCPYGRKTNVGDTRCINCIFNRIGSDMCMGTKEKVRQHVKFLDLNY